LAKLYGMQTDLLATAGRDTLGALERVDQLRQATYHPANGADYGTDEFSRGLAAFYKDLGAEMRHTTVVAMTEFGRRVEENSAFGTDHGRGSVMFVMGGGVKGGRVAGKWPGLTRDVLEGPGDLPVVTNYRDVLAPILQRHGV